MTESMAVCRWQHPHPALRADLSRAAGEVYLTAIAVRKVPSNIALGGLPYRQVQHRCQTNDPGEDVVIDGPNARLTDLGQ